MVSGEALPILKEVFLTLTLGRCPLKIWVFVASITILGLDILCAYDTSMDLGHQMLRPAVEPQPCNLVVGNDQVILAQCEGVVMAQLESPIGVENGLIETNPGAHDPEGLCISRTFV
jgi:hypothetical protein